MCRNVQQDTSHTLIIPQNVENTGARGRSRTDTGLPPLDFESSTSTSFITRAMINPFGNQHSTSNLSSPRFARIGFDPALCESNQALSLSSPASTNRCCYSNDIQEHHHLDRFQADCDVMSTPIPLASKGNQSAHPLSVLD